MVDTLRADFPERFLPEHEIATGGMGAVWRVTDRQFDRPLAVKIMLPEKAANRDAVARFEREAQITGALQHPAIPPVADRGLLKNGNPYFSLKLIEGETLAALLNHRKTTTEDLPRFLGIFEQICQAVGYAHSQQIIHRDLKPANIMVGEFGEVQVMDWGVAKKMESATTKTTHPATTSIDGLMKDGSFAETVDLQNLDIDLTADTDDYEKSLTLTRGGQVLGTLAYMPPEQARGEQESLTAAADVFALGGILAKILIAKAPYGGNDILQVYRQVVATDLTDLFAALDVSGADTELIALCKQCLAANPTDRPADANHVANAIGDYEAATRQRLEEEKAEHAAADARAVEGKKRQRVMMVAAGLAILLLTGAGLGGWWYQKEETAKAIRQADDKARIAREEEKQFALENQVRAETLTTFARVKDLQQRYEFELGFELLNRAKNRLAVLPADDPAHTQLQQARRDLTMIQALDHHRLTMADPAVLREQGARPINDRYNESFKNYGIDIFSDPIEVSSDKIEQSDISHYLIDVLHEWRYVESQLANQMRILRVLELTDTPQRIQLIHDANEVTDKTVNEFVESVNYVQHTPLFLNCLSNGIGMRSNPQANLNFLRNVITYHPQHFWTHLRLGQKVPLELAEERIGHLRSAIAIRPDRTLPRLILANTLYRNKRNEEGLKAEKALLLIRPDSPFVHTRIGAIYGDNELFEEAVAAYRKALEIDPDYHSAREKLSGALSKIDRHEESLKEYQTYLRSQPASAENHNRLGVLYGRARHFQEAAEEYQKALKIDAEYSAAAKNLDYTQDLLKRIAEKDAKKSKLAQDEYEYRDAINREPENSLAHVRLGAFICRKGKYAESESILRRALELDPQNYFAYVELGRTLQYARRFDEAEEAFRMAIKLNPDMIDAIMELGGLHMNKENYSAAVREYRKAAELAPNSTRVSYSLGSALYAQKRYTEALQAFQNGLDTIQGPSRYENSLRSRIEWTRAMIKTLASEESPPHPDDVEPTP